MDTTGRMLRWSRGVQVTALSVALLAAAATATTFVRPGPAADTAASPTLSAGSPTATTRPVTPTPTPSPTPDPSGTAALGQSGAAAGPGPEDSRPGPTGCNPFSAVRFSMGSSVRTWTATFAPGPIDQSSCQGAHIRVAWASYVMDAGGNLTRYATAEYEVSAANPSVTFTVTIPGPCGYRWYVVIGDIAVPSSISYADVLASTLPGSGIFWNYTYGSPGAPVRDVAGPCPSPSTTEPTEPAPSTEPTPSPV